ncbi:MAG: tRNA uridine-5-carboxymethylaminomethyl(34) synthesis GTPase MnmE [Opitutaceae bacterium]|nr:tRNA uridine-5-carboxymethylaminomethyl(34) synthesis GTPase MnmE [Opitutaceae bacterium]
MPRHADTIAAFATPAGTAALAVLRITGPDTRRLATELGGASPPPRVARRLGYRSRSGELLDDVVATFYHGPKSYTGEDTMEISCHGNPFIAQQILEDLLARGCRPAGPGEFTQRAFLNGKMDLSQAEAVMDVIHARSERALQAANQQLRGALGRRMHGLVESLLAVLARIEAYVDFPDEDLPAEDLTRVRGELERLSLETDRLLATSHYGELLRDGIKTVIVGEPNVGKSSLLNRLIGRDRALVSPEPGTTRDFLEERILVGPHCLRLIDTAGLNPSPAPLEKLGMAKTMEQLAEADLMLLVLDASRNVLPEKYAELLAARNAIIVLNKSDLRDGEAASDLREKGRELVRVSALTGAGVETLVAAIVARAEQFCAAAGGETVAINARHAHALTEAQAGLASARDKLIHGEATELVASDLRAVLAAYGEITGKVDNERMLDHLFATFCIGK